MRQLRIKSLNQPACYHIICRITQGQHWLGEAEKVYLTSLLHRVARYCGVEVLTFCVMSNHFHLLIRVPEKALADTKLTVLQMIARVRHLYGNDAAEELALLSQLNPASSSAEQLTKLAAAHLGRMHELSIFMKLLKQRFTLWHNHRHGTRGTLWTERFKSVLVESRETGNDPLAVVAAYIDLNPVRAKVVAAAEDYPYSGIGSAAGGNTESQNGIVALSKTSDRTESLNRYQTWLAGAFCPASGSGATSSTSALHHQQAAFVKGAIIGSAAFVLEMLTTLLTLRRKVGPMLYTAGTLDDDLWVARRFRKG
jgi:putative transposase